MSVMRVIVLNAATLVHSHVNVAPKKLKDHAMILSGSVRSHVTNYFHVVITNVRGSVILATVETVPILELYHVLVVLTSVLSNVQMSWKPA